MMERRIATTCSFLLLICFGGVTSLRDVKLLVEPEVIIRGGTAALICSRDMQGAPLYSVKWYRGNHEFYRYTPLEDPDRMVFTAPGIYVDMNRSNGTQVVLRKMDLPLAGNFSCEVTADSPSFSTVIAYRFIDVIALPQSDPVLILDKQRYHPGDELKANCSSSSARPAVNLTIYVNNEPLHSSESSFHPTESGLVWTSISAQLKLKKSQFPEGRLRIKCTATINVNGNEVYRRSAGHDFFTPDADPRPERITLNGGASSSQKLCTILSYTLILSFFLIINTNRIILRL